MPLMSGRCTSSSTRSELSLARPSAARRPPVARLDHLEAGRAQHARLDVAVGGVVVDVEDQRAVIGRRPAAGRRRRRTIGASASRCSSLFASTAAARPSRPRSSAVSALRGDDHDRDRRASPRAAAEVAAAPPRRGGRAGSGRARSSAGRKLRAARRPSRASAASTTRHGPVVEALADRVARGGIVVDHQHARRASAGRAPRAAPRARAACAGTRRRRARGPCAGRPRWSAPRPAATPALLFSSPSQLHVVSSPSSRSSSIAAGLTRASASLAWRRLRAGTTA